MNQEFGIISMASNNLSKGILNFGKAYSYMEEYRHEWKA